MFYRTKMVSNFYKSYNTPDPFSRARENAEKIDSFWPIGYSSVYLNMLEKKVNQPAQVKQGFHTRAINYFTADTPQTIMERHKEAIMTFAKVPDNQKKLASSFKDLDGFIVFIINLDKEKLSLYLEITKDFKSLYPIFNQQFPMHELSKLLSKLDGERTKCFVEHLLVNDITYNFLTAPFEFSSLVKYLSLEQQLILLRRITTLLQNLINDSDCFSNVLMFLREEARTFVYELMQHKLPTFITSAFQFEAALMYLSIEQRAAIYEVMQEQLPDFIEGGESFSSLLKHLSADQRTAIYEKTKQRIPHLIKNCAYHVQEILRHLSENQRTDVYYAVKNQIIYILQEDAQYDFFGISFEFVTRFLLEAQRTDIYEKTKNNFPTYIKSPCQLGRALMNLLPAQCSDVCTIMMDQLPMLIKSGEDLADLLVNLTPEQRTAVYDAMKKQLPSLMKSKDGFAMMRKYLSKDQYSELLAGIKESSVQQKQRAIVHNEGNYSFFTKIAEQIGNVPNVYFQASQS